MKERCPMDETVDTNESEVDVVVIGAGFAGLYALHKLRNGMGLQVRSFDDAGDVGGTWYWNRYPGVRCDTEVTAYCYSFDRALFSEWRWNERYPRQTEILAYLNHVADRYDLRRSITFNTTIERAEFDESSNRWRIVTSMGERMSAQFIVAGVGLLSSTNFPNIPGIDSFEGQAYHTARWPHEGVDLRCKRVGVIGTGSSGVQCITEIAPQVRSSSSFSAARSTTCPRGTRRFRGRRSRRSMPTTTPTGSPCSSR